ARPRAKAVAQAAVARERPKKAMAQANICAPRNRPALCHAPVSPGDLQRSLAFAAGLLLNGTVALGSAANVLVDRGLVLGSGLGELMGPVVAGDEVEIAGPLGSEHGLESLAAGVGDRPGREPLVGVRVVRVIGIPQVNSPDPTLELPTGLGPLLGDGATVDDGGIGLQQLRLEAREPQPVEEHAGDPRALGGLAGLLLDQRGHDHDLVIAPAELGRQGLGSVAILPA